MSANPRYEAARNDRNRHARRARPGLARRPTAERLESRSLLSAFGLDSSFNGVGTATIPIGNGAGNAAAAVAVQADNSVVLVGSIENSAGNSDFLIDRLTPAGTPDLSFGTMGQVNVGFDISGDLNDHAEAVAVESDGKIVVAGYSDQAGTGGAATSVFSVARLNSDGSLDTTFGTGGRVTIAFAGNVSQSAQYVTILPGNQVLVVGSGTTSAAGPGSNLDMARLNADGSPDKTFGTNGQVTQTAPPLTTGVTNVTFTSATTDSTGRILVGGGAYLPPSSNPAGGPVSTSSVEAFVERFASNGTLDATYGNSGVAQVVVATGATQTSGGGNAAALATQTDGSVVLDATDPGNIAVAAARLTPAGVLDTTFGTSGIARITFPNATAVGAGPIGVLPDGRIVVTAQVQDLNASQPYNAFGAAYLFANGAPDVGFGNPGEVGTTTFQFGLAGETASPVGLAVQADGRVVVAAEASTAVNSAVDFGVARFALNSPASLTADQNFVRALYQTFLGRQGSLAELNFHVGELALMGRSGVTREIGTSPEAAAYTVDNLYLRYLSRHADPGGQATYAAEIKAGATAESVAASLVTSPEFASDLGNNTDTNYVNRLYEVILGRTPSASETSFYVGLVPSLTRLGVAQTFLASAEYRSDTIAADYTSILGRTASSSEVAFYANSTIPLGTIPLIFASSDEYYARASTA